MPRDAGRILEMIDRTPIDSDTMFGPERDMATELVRHLETLEKASPLIAGELERGIWQIPQSLPAVDFVVDEYIQQSGRFAPKPFANYVLSRRRRCPRA